jgi:hypothetical protein
MIQQVVHNLGVFLVPQAIVSAITLGLIAAYALATLRGEFADANGNGRAIWRRPLDSLASIAVSIGLLGSVWSFMRTFSVNGNGRLDIDAVVNGLGVAYTTTGVGLVTAIIATTAVFVLDAVARTHEHHAEPAHT